MRLQNIHLKNFRCFQDQLFDFDSDVVIIEGNNGSGKTSLVEAIHYLCYVKSFRTRHNIELARMQADKQFFISGSIYREHAADLETHHTISVGFHDRKKRVRIDETVVGSYKELFKYYQVVTITDADIDIIRSGPSHRRSFLDEVVLLDNFEYVEVLRAYKDVLAQKNALLHKKSFDKMQYDMWTKKLFSLASHIVQQRKRAIEILHTTIDEICKKYNIEEYRVAMEYQAKHNYDVKEIDNNRLQARESIMGRALVGSHVDEIAIEMLDRNMRIFGSRGQQKFATLLLKIAQITYLINKGQRPIFVLDDFVTDFDKHKLSLALSIISDLPVQVIFTTPLDTKLLFGSSNTKEAAIIRL